MNIVKQLLKDNTLKNTKIKLEISGLVRSFEGNIIETDPFPATVGSICEIECTNNRNNSAEIIGFRNNKNLIAMHQSDNNVKIGSKVRLVNDGVNLEVSDDLLGRVLDGMGNPLDGKEKIFSSKQSKVWIQALNRVHVQKSILLYCFGKLR